MPAPTMLTICVPLADAHVTSLIHMYVAFVRFSVALPAPASVAFAHTICASTARLPSPASTGNTTGAPGAGLGASGELGVGAPVTHVHVCGAPLLCQ